MSSRDDALGSPGRLTATASIFVVPSPYTSLRVFSFFVSVYYVDPIRNELHCRHCPLRDVSSLNRLQLNH